MLFLIMSKRIQSNRFGDKMCEGRIETSNKCYGVG